MLFGVPLSPHHARLHTRARQPCVFCVVGGGGRSSRCEVRCFTLFLFKPVDTLGSLSIRMAAFFFSKLEIVVYNIGYYKISFLCEREGR